MAYLNGSWTSITAGMTNTGSLALTSSVTPLMQATASINFATGALNTFTGSIRTEINGLEEYTASLKGQAIVSSSTQISSYYKFAETASANTFYGVQTFSGSFNVSGSTIQTGNNTLIGNTVLSGSINVSGSSNFNNSEFRITGSTFFTGSHYIVGNTIFSGSLKVSGSTYIEGDYYKNGNKQFNYVSLVNTGSVLLSSATLYSASFINGESPYYQYSGFYLSGSAGSGTFSKIVAENTGIYNIQYSFQLDTNDNQAASLYVWIAKNGTDIAYTNSIFGVANNGYSVPACNILLPIESGSYIQLRYATEDTNLQLATVSSSLSVVRPIAPAIIATITQVA